MDIKPVASIRAIALDPRYVGCGYEHYLYGPESAEDGDALIYDQSAIDALTAEVERLSRANSSVRFELDMLEQVRLRDNEYLIVRAEAAEAEAARLRQELAAMKGEG